LVPKVVLAVVLVLGELLQADAARPTATATTANAQVLRVIFPSRPAVSSCGPYQLGADPLAHYGLNSGTTGVPEITEITRVKILNFPEYTTGEIC
jgi:hypothetical protein